MKTLRAIWSSLVRQHHEPELPDAVLLNEAGPLLDCGHRSHAIAKDQRTGVTRCLACYDHQHSSGI